MTGPAIPAQLSVTVVHSPSPRLVNEIALVLPHGARVQDALQTDDLLKSFPGLDLAEATLGVWGRKVDAQQALVDGDRIEIYRALKVDPKVARRERFAKQGARTTGLFARKRAGAKAGY